VRAVRAATEIPARQSIARAVRALRCALAESNTGGPQEARGRSARGSWRFVGGRRDFLGRALSNQVVNKIPTED
jgi:hypothetical protein